MLFFSKLPYKNRIVMKLDNCACVCIYVCVLVCVCEGLYEFVRYAKGKNHLNSCLVKSP